MIGLQERIKPMEAQSAPEFKSKNPGEKVENPDNQVDFMSLLRNSNQEVQRGREAKKNNDFSGAKNYDEFLEQLSSETQKKRTPKNAMDKDDFLKLFVTQLKYQDPLNPDDSTEMAAQLAQFNGLEQMMNLNKTMGELLSGQKSGRNLELVNYLGKEISLEGGRFRLEKGEVSDTTFNLKLPANKTRVEVRDGGGVLVHAQDLGGMNAGEQKFRWNGMKADGTRATDGIYTLSVVANGPNNEEIPATIETKTKISGVDLKNQDGGLYTNLGNVRLDEVKAIGEIGYSAQSKLLSANAKQDDLAKVAAPANIPPDLLQAAQAQAIQAVSGASDQPPQEQKPEQKMAPMPEQAAQPLQQSQQPQKQQVAEENARAAGTQNNAQSRALPSVAKFPETGPGNG